MRKKWLNTAFGKLLKMDMWYRASEVIPDSEKWVMGVFKDRTGWVCKLPYVCKKTSAKYAHTEDGWFIRGCDEEYYKGLKCVAWCEFPEWKGELFEE